MVEDTWLLTAEGEAWDPDQLPTIITRILRKASGNHAVVFHTLRRSSATWLLVRWFAARRWPLRLSPNGVWAKEAFCRDALEGVQQLIGTDGRRVLWQIAALYGHLSPEVTLAHYVGAADWIEAHRPPSPPRKLNYHEAAPMLEPAGRYIYEYMGRDFSEDKVLATQIARLDKERSNGKREPYK